MSTGTTQPTTQNGFPDQNYNLSFQLGKDGPSINFNPSLLNPDNAGKHPRESLGAWKEYSRLKKQVAPNPVANYLNGYQLTEDQEDFLEDFYSGFELHVSEVQREVESEEVESEEYQRSADQVALEQSEAALDSDNAQTEISWDERLKAVLGNAKSRDKIAEIKKKAKEFSEIKSVIKYEDRQRYQSIKNRSFTEFLSGKKKDQSIYQWLGKDSGQSKGDFWLGIFNPKEGESFEDYQRRVKAKVGENAGSGEGWLKSAKKKFDEGKAILSKGQKAAASPLGAETIQNLRDTGALNNKLTNWALTDEQKSMLRKLGPKKTDLRLYLENRALDLGIEIEDKLNAKFSPKIDAYLENKINPNQSDNWKSKAAKFIQNKRKNDGKSVLRASTDLAKYVITAPLRGLKKVGTIGLEAAKASRVGQGLSQIKSSASTTWNNVKATPVYKAASALRRYGGNAIQFAGDGLNGTKTGMIYAASGFILGGPAGAAAAFATGTAVGAGKNYLSRIYNTNLNSYTGKMYGWQTKLALNNPQNIQHLLANADNFNWIKSNNIKQVVQQLKINPGLFDNVLLRKGTRQLSKLFATANSFGIGFGVGLLLSGFNPAAALAVGAGLSGTHYLVLSGLDKVGLEILSGNKKLLGLLNFPGFAALDVLTGSFTVAEQVNILREEGIDGFWKDQTSQLIPGFGLKKGFANVLGAAGYVTGTGAITGALHSAGITAGAAFSALPTGIKYAPLILPALYLAGSLLFGYTVSVGALIALTGAGIIATGVGLLGGIPTFGLGAVPGAVATGLALTPLAVWFGTNVLDPIIDKFSSAIGGIESLTNLMGVYNIFKSFLDLLEKKMTSLSSYAQAATIAISFLTGWQVLVDFTEKSAEYAETIQEAETESNGEAIQNEVWNEYQVLAITYKIPPAQYNCAEVDLNNYQNFEVKEIIKLNKGGEIVSNIIGESDGNEMVITDIKNINHNIHENGEISSSTNLGDCL